MKVLLLILLLSLPGLACRGVATACKSNLKNLGTALEMFASDHQGRYPKSLAELVPVYLKSIPPCPGAGRDSYSASYVVRNQPDCYLIYCCGRNHEVSGMQLNYPAYNPYLGLIDRPDSLSSGACREALRQRRPVPGHHLEEQDKPTRNWIGCYGLHLHEQWATREITSSGLEERLTATPPEVLSQMPPWKAWVGPVLLTMGLARLTRKRR
jgi:hypothetical protein